MNSARPSNIVVTVPPWAQDEPPSPKDRSSIDDSHLATQSRPSDVASYQSTYPSVPGSPSRWWAFTLPRPRVLYDDSTAKPERKSINFKERTSSWLPTASSLRDGTIYSRKNEKGMEMTEGRDKRNWDLSLTLPPPSAQPFTLAQNTTPGWETPWTARVTAQGPSRQHGLDSSSGLDDSPVEESEHDHEAMTRWQRRRKRLRSFILSNTYVPLLFRFLNITFTAASLGLAIRVRRWEKQSNAMGAVGSSPTLVIIFAPLTLVHIMVAIYLEYFGRPLGLWRTSGKLAHTLLDVLFICAWSAALSLCFDNFFTSVIPCAPESSISWYNDLPRPPSNLPTFEGSIGDRICDGQLALICLTSIGLLIYCTSLIISLYRIFEKVKYHQPASDYPL